MAKLTDHITASFESLTNAICRHPKKAIAIMVLFAAMLTLQLPTLKIDTATEAFFHKTDPVLMKYREFQSQFGMDETLIVAVNPPETFDQGFLKKLKNFHEDLEKSVPHVKEVTSLWNARSTFGKEDELIVEDLLETWPENDRDMEILKNRVMTNPSYKNAMISQDGRYTAFVIEPDTFSFPAQQQKGAPSMEAGEDLLSGFDEAETDPLAGFEEDAAPSAPGKKQENGQAYLTDQEVDVMLLAVKEVMARHESPDFPLYLAGSPAVDYEVKANIQKDMGIFMGLALVTIAAFLFLLFRRLSGVLLPLLVVILSLVSTFGLMALIGVTIKVPTQILPSFLIAVGVGDSVHVLAIFYRRFRSGQDQVEAIKYAIGHSGTAILMTSITTAGGLMSFIASDLTPVAEIGIYAPAGVMLALVYTVVLLPALLAVIPLSKKQGVREEEIKPGSSKGKLDQIIIRVSDFSTGNPRGIIVVSVILLVVSLLGASRLHFSYNPLVWMSEESAIRKDTKVIDTHLGGSLSLEMLLDTGKEKGWYDPKLLAKLGELSISLEQYKEGPLFVGQTYSLADVIKEIHQALNENKPEFHAIPQDKNLVAQEILLFENSGSDDLQDVVDTLFSEARFSMKLPALDAVLYTKFIGETEEKFKAVFGDEVKVTVTGFVAILFRAITAMIHSMTKSYIIAFIVITLLMVIIMGDIRIGLVSMIPNLLPIIMTLGLMGWVGIPLDAFTLLIGSIAIGLVVDDTIHFMHNFGRYYQETGDSREAVRNTLQTSGRAILLTSIVLSAGFFVFLFSSMKNLVYFGLLTGFTIHTALLAEFTLTPVLMVLVTKGRERKAE